MSVVVISTVTFVLGTMPELTDNLDIMLFDNETEVMLMRENILYLGAECEPDLDTLLDKQIIIISLPE